MVKIAFQGVEGAYSHEAILNYFGQETECLPVQAFADLFAAIEDGQSDFAILPIENAVAGSVSQSYELLLEHDLVVHAEVIHPVRHMLMVPEKLATQPPAIVRSHPQALAQCSRYIDRHGLTPEAAFDTAGSARDLAADPQPGVAAIASETAARLYGMKVIDSNIQDFSFNFTRFFILAKKHPQCAQKNKTSVIFSTPHIPGVLSDCLAEFAQRKINLTRIESRPRLNKPWQYIFILDFEGHAQEPKCEAALMGLLRRASFVKLLGSYPAAATPEFASTESQENGGLL